MKNFKQFYMCICIAIALVIAIVVSCVEVTRTPEMVAKFSDPPSEQDYQELEEYAILYAKTLNTGNIKRDDINISSSLKENQIEITVSELKCKVIATYPIEFTSTTDGTFETIILYENGTYEHCSNLESMWSYIATILLFSLFNWFGIYLVIYYPIIFMFWLIIVIKKGIQKSE